MISIQISFCPRILFYFLANDEKSKAKIINSNEQQL
jgi:hypothetical protein